LERVPVGRVGADDAAARAVATWVRDEEETVLTVGSGRGAVLEVWDDSGIIAEETKRL
jgi:hypothetical protein